MARQFCLMVRGAGRITESRLILRVFLRTAFWRLLGMFPLGSDSSAGRMPLQRERIERRDCCPARFGRGHEEGVGLMKFAYYPGSSLRGTGRAYEESLLAVFRALDAKLEDDTWATQSHLPATWPRS